MQSVFINRSEELSAAQPESGYWDEMGHGTAPWSSGPPLKKSSFIALFSKSSHGPWVVSLRLRWVISGLELAPADPEWTREAYKMLTLNTEAQGGST